MVGSLVIGLYAVLAAASLALGGSGAARGIASQLSLLFPFAAFAVVGGVLLNRRPGNSIGRLYAVIGLSAGLKLAATDYAEAAFRLGRDLPFPTVAAWIQNWAWWPAIGFAGTLVFQLFPTGRPLSRRWRVLVAVSLTAVALLSLSNAFFPRLVLDSSLSGTADPIRLDNPVGIPGDAMDFAFLAGGVLLLACLVGSIASLIVRFRRARGVERLQLRWLAYSAVLLGLAFTVGNVVGLGARDDAWLDVSFGICLGLIPVTTGIAVMRYRLYDIDRVINRTLVYAALTVLLGATYAVGVILARAALAPLTTGSDLAVALTTLLVAALVRPVQRRVQVVVDRRFYRSKYDAGQTVDEFRTRLRQQVDLDVLSADLLTVVERTVQPAGVSLWLRR